MPPQTISSTRCNVCFFENRSSVKELFLCSKCEFVRYCGPEHQLLDWALHKDFCKAVQFLKKMLKLEHLLCINGFIRSRRDFEKTAVAMKLEMRTTLGRDLGNFEEELLTFPKCCNLCFTHKVYANYDCEKCGVASYCCEEHKQEDLGRHEKICYHLKVYYNFFNFEDFNIHFDFQHSVDFKSENHLFDVLTKSSANNKNIPKKPNNLQEFQPFFIASSYSFVATILYGYHLYYSKKSAPNKLRFFIVGAKDELNWFKEDHLRFLFSQIPSLSFIKIYFIGPELTRKDTDPFKSLYSFHLNKLERKAEFQFHAKTFQKFIEKMSGWAESENKPDLIVSFNCGFSEFSQTSSNTWRLGIQQMLAFKDTPILFTSYTKSESCLDLEEVDKVAKKKNILYQILVGGKNPYKDYRPFRNWEVSDEFDPIFFRNGYLHMIVSKDSKS